MIEVNLKDKQDDPINPNKLHAILECPCNNIQLQVDEETSIPVLLRNVSSKSLTSHPFGIFLSYHWLNPEGDIHPSLVFLTPLNLKIESGESRLVMQRVKAPDMKGKFALIIGLVQLGSAQITSTTIPDIIVTNTQQRVFANRFQKALKNGNLSFALECYQKDRESFGITRNDEEVAIFRIASVKEWCKTHNLPYKKIKEGTKLQIHKPNLIGKSKPLTYEGYVSLPEIYLAEIRDVVIIGGQNPIIMNNEVALIDDYFFREIRWEDDIISLKLDDDVLIVRFWKNQHKVSIPVIDCGILLDGLFTFNYYHWVVEYLAQFWAIDQCPEYNNIPLIVSNTLSENFLEALSALNVNKRELLPIEYGAKYHVKKLIIPSRFTYYTTRHITYKDETVSPIAINFLRERLKIERRASGKKSRKRLYIWRRELYRRLLNEKEIEALFRIYEFEFINPQNLSFSEQIDLFSSASIIAGTHGAGWTNIIFAPSSTRGLMLVGPQVTYLYSNIAHAIGQELFHIQGDCVSSESVDVQFNSDFVVNIEEVEFALDMLCGKQGKLSENEFSRECFPNRRLKTDKLPEVMGETAF